MNGETVKYGINNNLQGYLSLPSTNNGPGLIILQEWWGLVDHIKHVADRYAEKGFVVLAPDLYDGQTTVEPNEAQKLMMELKIENASTKIKSSINFLKDKNYISNNKIGCIGYCMGGGLALYMATQHIIDAAVPYYGVLINVEPDWSQVNCPILGHYAEHDQATESLEQITVELNKYNIQHTFHIYEKTEHAFFNNERPEIYSEHAAELSFERTIKFLNENIK